MRRMQINPALSHYDILEVSPKAGAEVIRAAYKSLMQRNHPDRNFDALESTARTAAISSAYDVLSDPEKRRVYDETLADLSRVEASPDRPSHRRSAASVGRQNKPVSSSRQRTWYATVLILSVIGAGAAILVLSKRKAAPPPVVQAISPAPAPAIERPLLALDAGESSADLQARTVSAFVTDLRIELSPSDSARSGIGHVLLIPDLGLRLAPGVADRYRPQIKEKRSQIIRQLLVTLSNAPYHELIKEDGDLYLKKLIEASVAASIGLELSAAVPAASPPFMAPQGLLEVFLPLSFSIQ